MDIQLEKWQFDCGQNSSETMGSFFTRLWRSPSPTKSTSSNSSSPSPSQDVVMTSTQSLMARSEPVLLGVDPGNSDPSAHDAESIRPAAPSPKRNSRDVVISLVPHAHTLFCERKQRVCTAVGKTQELESLTVENLQSNQISNCVWLRSPVHATEHTSLSQYREIEGSENNNKYQLCSEDVGCYIQFRLGRSVYAVKPMGPVLPGPPRMIDLRIVGDMCPGQRAIAEGMYIGGNEGPSEYWWLRIKNGHRENLNEPVAIDPSKPFHPTSKSDPRIHLITDDDIGAELKVKCRPIRSDGWKGEIFTSKSSAIVSQGALMSNKGVQI